MNSVFERIRYSSNLPARVEIKQGKIAEAYHWHKEIELPDLRQYAIIADILHVLFVQCRQENPDTVKDGEKIQSRHVKLAVEFIEQHYREELTEKGVAKSLGVEPIYLSQRFKEATGKTFTGYVMEFRLNRAMDALLHKQLSIDDAAKAGGFPSARTFIAKCKKVYHITPFQLLKQRAEVRSNV